MSEIDKQLKKGVIEILILKLLSLDNMYGYQLIQELDTRSQGIFKMKEGTLYPILYRLEDNSLIESYWEQDSQKRGVPRKYYKITEAGLIEFQNMKNDLMKMFTSINSIMQEGNYNE